MGYPWSMRFSARVPRFFVACALLTTGCVGDLLQLPSTPAPAVRAPADRVAGLWDLAPADAVSGVVIHDGALARALALVADPDPSPARTGFEELAQDKSKLPFDPLSPDAWAGAGLDPQKGAAAFNGAKKGHGIVFVLPVKDRALFRRAFGLFTRTEGGQEVDVLDDGDTVCAPAAGRYLCAHSLEVISQAAAPHASPLAEGAEGMEEHGEVELYMTRDDPSIAAMNHHEDSMGWITGVTGTLRLRDDGATLHIAATGSLATPTARGLYAAIPPSDLLALAGGAATVGRIHVDPSQLLKKKKDLDPEVRSELVDQLTGDVEVLPGGPGFANATILLPVVDAPRVEAFVKKRCAEEGRKKEVRPLGDFKVEAHGCSAVFDTRRLTIPVKFPTVPVVIAVASGRLVVTIGEAQGAPGPQAAADPRDGDGAEGEAVKRLIDSETVLFFGHDLGIGPDVGPGTLFRDAIPLLGGRVAAAVEAWDYASAHISQALVRVKVTDEGVDFTVDLTGFGADPPAAREAYRAALARRFADDAAGYKAALAGIERRFPGTRAARRAAEVRKGAPFFGAGVALMGTLGLMGNGEGKKR